MLKAMSMAIETSVFIDNEQREAVLRGIFETFHGGLPAGHVSFDTNRHWCARLALLAKLYPEARVICCVRDVASIVNSIERLVDANPLEPSGMFGFDPSGSVYTRADALGAGNGMIGSAFNALRQAFYGPYSDRLLIVTYETLTSDTPRALAEIYNFLGHEPFKHDLSNIAFDATEFDRRLGTPGLHRVDREIRPASSQKSMLPPELMQKYAADNFWRDAAANANQVRVI